MNITPAVVHWNDPHNDPSDWSEVMTYSDAWQKAKELSKAGFETRIYKLVEIGYFAPGRPDADAG